MPISLGFASQNKQPAKPVEDVTQTLPRMGDDFMSALQSHNQELKASVSEPAQPAQAPAPIDLDQHIKTPANHVAQVDQPAQPSQGPGGMHLFKDEQEMYQKMKADNVSDDQAHQMLKARRQDISGGMPQITQDEAAMLLKMKASGETAKDAFQMIQERRQNSTKLNADWSNLPAVGMKNMAQVLPYATPGSWKFTINPNDPFLTNAAKALGNIPGGLYNLAAIATNLGATGVQEAVGAKPAGSTFGSIAGGLAGLGENIVGKAEQVKTAAQQGGVLAGINKGLDIGIKAVGENPVEIASANPKVAGAIADAGLNLAKKLPGTIKNASGVIKEVVSPTTTKEAVTQQILDIPKNYQGEAASAQAGLEKVIGESKLSAAPKFNDLEQAATQKLAEIGDKLGAELGKIKGKVVDNKQVDAALKQIKDAYSSDSSKAGEALNAKIDSLIEKSKTQGLTAREVQDVKLMHTDASPNMFSAAGEPLKGFTKEQARNLRSDLRQTIEDMGNSEGVTGIKKINQDWADVNNAKEYLKDQSDKVTVESGKAKPSTILDRTVNAAGKIPGVKQAVGLATEGVAGPLWKLAKKAVGENGEANLSILQKEQILGELVKKFKKSESASNKPTPESPKGFEKMGDINKPVQPILKPLGKRSPVEPFAEGVKAETVMKGGNPVQRAAGDVSQPAQAGTKAPQFGEPGYAQSLQEQPHMADSFMSATKDAPKAETPVLAQAKGQETNISDSLILKEATKGFSREAKDAFYSPDWLPDEMKAARTRMKDLTEKQQDIAKQYSKAAIDEKNTTELDAAMERADNELDSYRQEFEENSEKFAEQLRNVAKENFGISGISSETGIKYVSRRIESTLKGLDEIRNEIGFDMKLVNSKNGLSLEFKKTLQGTSGGKAGGQYNPNTKGISLAETRAIYHEYAHFLDNVSSESNYLEYASQTSAPAGMSKIPDKFPIGKAASSVYDEAIKTKMFKKASEADTISGRAYWTKKNEVFARAFDQYFNKSAALGEIIAKEEFPKISVKVREWMDAFKNNVK